VSPGYIVSLVIAGLSIVGTFVAFFVLLIVEAVGGLGESDKYGRVPVPGEATIELPRGEASIFYEEAVSLGEDESLVAPRGLDYSVRSAGGGPPLAKKGEGGFDEEVSDSGTTRSSYAEIDVPRAGPYLVQTSLRGGRAGPMPALTFGEPLSGRIFDKLGYALLGLLGLALAALIAIVTFTRNRMVRADERVTMPPDQTPKG
jgi:hypothetical protein